jgi:ubiquinone/menaquinone biosynthesis C-methylase UbiE
MTKQHHPDAQIAAGNPWYTADQHRSQLGSRGRRRLIEYRWRVFAEMLCAWRDRTGGPGAMTILDAGCGDGINLRGLRLAASRCGFAMTLVGVDYNRLRLARAQRVDEGARLQQSSLYQLPFTGASFDAVLCNHVLEHVPDLTAAIAELYRVLRPGGLLIVGVPNEGCLMAQARNRVVQPWIGRTTDHVHFFTSQSIAQALERQGFVVRRIARETFFFPCSYVNAACTEVTPGHWLMSALRVLLPSQAGGLIVASEKPGEAS